MKFENLEVFYYILKYDSQKFKTRYEESEDMLDNMINNIEAMDITEVTKKVIKEGLQYVVFNVFLSIEKLRNWKIFQLKTRMFKTRLQKQIQYLMVM